VTDEPVPAQPGQRAERLGDRLVGGAVNGLPEVDHVEHVQPQLLEVLVDLGGQFGRCKGRVLIITRSGVSRVVSFNDSGLFATFGLPESLSAIPLLR
jgi:hypothetical protein